MARFLKANIRKIEDYLIDNYIDKDNIISCYELVKSSFKIDK